MAKAIVTAAGAAIALALVATPGAAHGALGPDAPACSPRSGRIALLVNVRGFRQRTGNLRVQLYGGNPAEFLERGRWLKRIDVPVTRHGTMPVCVALPRAGRYAVAVRHDVDGNGRSGWNDGGGFSRNPRLSLPNPRPNHRQVAIDAPAGVQAIDIVLNYRSGLSIGPVGGGGR